MPKQIEQRWAEWKGSQPQHTKLRRAENDSNQPRYLPVPLAPSSLFMAEINSAYEGESTAILRMPLRFNKVRRIKIITKPKKLEGGDLRSYLETSHTRA